MADEVVELMRRIREGSTDAEADLLELVRSLRLAVWRPIAEAPILAYADTTSYYRYRCLIQTNNGEVMGGYARWANKGGRGSLAPDAPINVEVRWYSDHSGHWRRDAKYFMPMPEPRKD
jgi:hypothetical protein